MTNYVVSIDPGMSTGIALLSYEESRPARLVKAWQFPGGVTGLTKWVGQHWDGRYWDDYNDCGNVRGFYHWKMGVDDRLNVDSHIEYDYDSETEEDWETEIPPNTVVISEKFTPRQNAGFALTMDSVEPLRGEGALIALGLMPDYSSTQKRWRDPKYQYVVGGKDKADKKKRLHLFLKESGYYVTNKDFPDSPAKDAADDARSGIGHGLSYIARELKHRPTFDLISGWSSEH